MKTEYNRRNMIAKRETREKHRQSWDSFVSNLERDLMKLNPRNHKIL
jgi:hypothetical protein